jgi:hypothetical protein
MNPLQAAIQKRDNFLNENPHLKPLQDEIDRILDKCVESDRLAVINMMMMQNVIDLQKETLKLKGML